MSELWREKALKVGIVKLSTKIGLTPGVKANDREIHQGIT
jgi:hypothetical protein